MPMTQLPRIALIVTGILLVLITVVLLSRPKPGLEIKVVPEIQGVQEIQGIQEVQGVQEIPPAISSPVQVPTRSKDLMKIDNDGLQLKSAPANEVHHTTKSIQLKDPVQGMEKELDDWMEKPSGFKMNSGK